jgi:putative transposase
MLRAFEIIKEAVAKLPFVVFPDFERPFHLATDASFTGIGAVLFQPTVEQERLKNFTVTGSNIVAISSRALQDYESRYFVYKLECLALIAALRHFRDILIGRHFIVHTDHRPLVYFMRNM